MEDSDGSRRDLIGMQEGAETEPVLSFPTGELLKARLSKVSKGTALERGFLKTGKAASWGKT
jgi:hypothetical protein